MSKMRLSVKLPLLTIVSAGVTIVLIILLALLLIRHTVKETETAALANSLRGYESAIDFFLDEARSVIEITAQGKRIIEYSAAFPAGASTAAGRSAVDRDMRDLSQSILKNSRLFEYLMLANAEGVVYMIEPQRLHKALSRKDLAFASWYKKLIESGRTVTSDLHISTATQRPTVVVATPVRDRRGRIIGIWAGGINLTTLSHIGIPEELPVGTSNRYGQVTDSRGLIIAHQGNLQYVREQTDFSSVPVIQAALRRETGTMQYISPIDGRDKLGAYMPLSDTGWSVTYVEPLSVALSPVYALTRNIGWIGALAVIVMGLGGVVIARQVIKPLERLKNGAVTIGAGDLTQRIEKAGTDEIGDLAAEFNRMAESLSEKDLQLRNYINRLENANKELEAFSYTVSHDLRAPLRHINGFVELLTNRFREALPEKGVHYLDAIADSARQMAALIDDLLQFSRSGRLEVQKIHLDMNHLLREVLESLKTEYAGRSIEWVVAKLPPVFGDRAMLRQVWFNLLHNAVKFTRKTDKARVEIGCREEGMELFFFVRDNGVGFDMQYAHKLFGVFQRLHATDDFEGTGIGLAHVRRIIAKHGGRTWAEAVLNQGAVFYFTLLKDKEGRQ